MSEHEEDYCVQNPVQFTVHGNMDTFDHHQDTSYCYSMTEGLRLRGKSPKSQLCQQNEDNGLSRLSKCPKTSHGYVQVIKRPITNDNCDKSLKGENNLLTCLFS